MRRESAMISEQGPSRLPLVPLAALAILAAGSLSWGGYHALTSSADLMRRVDEVVLVVRGLDPYMDPDMTYPPTAPAVFVPLVAPFAGHPGWLRAFWLALNLGSLGVAVGLILRSWGRGWSWYTRAALGLVLFASKPARLAIGMGQFALLPLALVLAADVAARRGRAGLAGGCLAVALIKPTMVLPFLVVFAIRGHWRTLAVAVALQGIALVGISAWLHVGPVGLIREWLAVAASQRSAGLIDIPSLAARWDDGLADVSGPITLAVLGAGSVLMVACRRAPNRTLMAFAGFVAAIMAYHRPYDLVLLFPALAVLTEAARSRDGRGAWRLAGARLAAALFAALLIAPAHPSLIAEADYNRLFIPATYAFLALVMVQMARQGRQGVEPPVARQRSEARLRVPC